MKWRVTFRHKNCLQLKTADDLAKLWVVEMRLRKTANLEITFGLKKHNIVILFLNPKQGNRGQGRWRTSYYAYELNFRKASRRVSTTHPLSGLHHEVKE
jgi:hypothetical protein